MHTRALVLFSGGQDSATCLAWALNRFAYVETVGFNYGQRHAVELDCRRVFIERLRELRPDWSERLGQDHVLDVTMVAQISQSAMTENRAIEMQANGMPNTFVPGRNVLFFTLTAALAYRRDLSVLVGGMCETDYSGYPDCRDDTLKSLQVTLGLALDTRLVIETPLMWLDKAQTWALAEDLGGEPLVRLIESDTHTCYLGDRARRHEWGFGCGTCPACELRQTGHARFRTGQARRAH